MVGDTPWNRVNAWVASTLAHALLNCFLSLTVNLKNGCVPYRAGSLFGATCPEEWAWGAQPKADLVV